METKVIKSIKEYEIEVVGVSPLLMNKLSKELNDDFKKIERGKKDEWQDENWRRKIYTRKIEGKEVILIPELNLHAMLSEAGRKYRVPPPREVGRTWTYYIKASCIVENPLLLEISEPEPFSIMVNGNPSSAKKSSKVYTVRPRFEKWGGKFSFKDMSGYMNKEIVDGLLTTAGLFVGLGDWRPQNGRFKIVKITENIIKV